MEKLFDAEQEMEQPRKPTCLRWVFISIVIVLVICSVTCLWPVVVSTYLAQKHQHIWNEYGSDAYTITLHGDGIWMLPDLLFSDIESQDGKLGDTYEVCDNRIVRINNQPCSDSSNPEKCDIDPITILFQEARECTYFCAVEFDSKYGYPSEIEYQNFDLNQFVWVFDYSPITCP